MPEDHFGESVAAQYDDSADEMFDGVVIDQAVSFLADLAGGGSALELGNAIRPVPIAAAVSRCARTRLSISPWRW